MGNNNKLKKWVCSEYPELGYIIARTKEEAEKEFCCSECKTQEIILDCSGPEILKDNDEHFEELVEQIKQLRAERDTLKQQVYTLEADKQHLLDDVEALVRNLKDACIKLYRYREALEEISNHYENLDNDGEAWESEAFEFVGQYADIAEEALKEADND